MKFSCPDSPVIRYPLILFVTTLCVAVLVCSAVSAQAPPVSADVPVEGGEVDTDNVMRTHVINPLDRLRIAVYASDKLQFSEEKFVQSDGTVYLPFIEEDVHVGGLIILEAQKKIEDLSRKTIKEPRVVITVMSSYSQNVSTYGKILTRNFQLNAPTRVLQIIAQAGGPQEDALEDSVRVISKDGSIRYFNYKKVNRTPTNKENFFVKPGDIIFVPSIEDFSVIIFGEVRTAGVYEMERGEKLLDALVKAGSWSSQADIKNVRVMKSRGNTLFAYQVNIDDIFNKGDTGDARLNLELQDGDIIYVPQSRAQIRLQLWSTFFSMLQTMVYIYSMYLVMRE